MAPRLQGCVCQLYCGLNAGRRLGSRRRSESDQESLRAAGDGLSLCLRNKNRAEATVEADQTPQLAGALAGETLALLSGCCWGRPGTESENVPLQLRSSLFCVEELPPRLLLRPRHGSFTCSRNCSFALPFSEAPTRAKRQEGDRPRARAARPGQGDALLPLSVGPQAGRNPPWPARARSGALRSRFHFSERQRTFHLPVFAPVEQEKTRVEPFTLETKAGQP